MKIRIESHEKLSGLIPGLDLRCGGRGTCGRCRVLLLSGQWKVNGRLVAAPGEALACHTWLYGESGEVEVPENALHQAAGQVQDEWRGRELPFSEDSVIAVDIGTTTVAAVKIREGRIVGRTSCFNSQNRFGDNVITRINHAGFSAASLKELREAAADSVGKLLDELGMEDAARIAIAGNTVMSYLFHGIDPAPIGVMPFTPPRRTFPATEFRGVPLYTMPVIAGFVGGDLTAGLFETRMESGEMLVDIGTNCEILFAAPQGIICTAAAAGPAFEGGGIYCGSRAVRGAIDHYRGRGDFSVLGGGEAKGLCGSAYIDFLAVERGAARLNEFGRYVPPSEKMDIADGIFVHERDIEQLLKAKAAVRAGIETLEGHCGAKASKIYLAGGFARFLDLENAVAIGMLPVRDYEIVGNTSLGGAARLAVDPGLMPELEKLIDLPREIPLNTLAAFEDNFIEGLLLP